MKSNVWGSWLCRINKILFHSKISLLWHYTLPLFCIAFTLVLYSFNWYIFITQNSRSSHSTKNWHLTWNCFRFARPPKDRKKCSLARAPERPAAAAALWREELQFWHSPVNEVQSVRRVPSLPSLCPFVIVLCRSLKIRNREFRFLLLFSERRNCESKSDSFSIHFTIYFWPTILEKRPKTDKESELPFFWNRIRNSSSSVLSASDNIHRRRQAVQ